MSNRTQSRELSATARSTHGSSKELLEYLQTLELVYRSELAEAETVMWLESLSCFPLQEVRAAVDALVLNPPEGWTGFPKLPDVIRQLYANRESAAEQKRIQNIERAPDPTCERCSGTGWRPAIDSPTRMVKCHCWAPRPKLPDRPQLPPAEEDRLTMRDVLKSVADKAGVNLETANKMPETREEPVSPILLNDELARKRNEQMLRELKEKGTIQ